MERLPDWLTNADNQVKRTARCFTLTDFWPELSQKRFQDGGLIYSNPGYYIVRGQSYYVVYFGITGRSFFLSRSGEWKGVLSSPECFDNIEDAMVTLRNHMVYGKETYNPIPGGDGTIQGEVQTLRYLEGWV